MAAQKKTVIEFPSVSDRAYRESRRHLKVDSIMSKKVVTTTPETTMNQAAQIMGEKHIGSLIVVKYKTPVAIVTERDVLSRVLATGKNLKKTLVGDVMSYPLIRICTSFEIREAARTMINKKARLVVYVCGKMAGIITASDLIRELPDAPETSMVVDDFMTREIVTADEDETVYAAATRMGKKRVGSVIVMSDDKPLGIFTERDLLSSFLVHSRSLDTPLREACSGLMTTAPAGISIHEAAKIMAAKHIRRLPIMKKKQIAGIITARDLVEAYAK
ncbi:MULTISPECIES: cyclic nucleotide-binding/CBS domain-containing protein [unclassified Methanoregula]|uniref:CBS domain-containing protein n=1 Tax=unclassified Methanoregula TaxID=2649730 RepID=UPI0009D5BE1A|nr:MULTISPECIES: CBS domain-containing protein [unclassified Methanoregula]OPX65302.1 MAG: Inosine-5'-monophosphate dehydrogenase [Methanoregula sp. PtaB.Bin085]OPY32211.1 MAG: Inosine-5'-monophosphate dehydrogenase [Methanoregula sp. PtaU1.Bin006]